MEEGEKNYLRVLIDRSTIESKLNPCFVFSFHEMGVKDLPAVLSYIGSTTGKGGEIIYIGHSMGTTMFFVMASELPDVAKSVKLMVALAPVAYMTHIKSPIRYLAPWVHDFQV